MTKRPRSNQTLRADFSAIEDDRAHADQTFVADSAGVDNRGMANGDIIAHDAGKIVRQMKDRVVLDIAVVANDDAVDVAAQDGVIPNAGAVAQGDVAHHYRAARDVDAFANDRFLAQKCVELFA